MIKLFKHLMGKQFFSDKYCLFTIVVLITTLLIFIIISLRKKSRTIVEIDNSKHNEYQIFMESVNLGFQHDLYLTLEKNGIVIWKNKRFDSRDIYQDVLDSYKFVVWKEDHIIIGPGRFKGAPKIKISDGNLLGFEKSVTTQASE